MNLASTLALAPGKPNREQEFRGGRRMRSGFLFPCPPPCEVTGLNVALSEDQYFLIRGTAFLFRF